MSDAILFDVITSFYGPFKAREITAIMKNIGHPVCKKQVSKRLYELEKEGLVGKDDEYRWFKKR
ncbi:hypothetical protein ACFL35_05415 [Candidatus Riflebacteria bacterium]